MTTLRAVALALILATLLLGGALSAAAQPPLPPLGPAGDILGAQPPVAAQPSVAAPPSVAALPSAAPDAALTTYTLPVQPTNLLPDGEGVWFTSFYNWAVGRVDLATGQVETYKLTDANNPWGVAAGKAGRIWFGTVNARPDYLVSLDPATAALNRWSVSRDSIFGLDADPVTGDVWFASASPAAINRLAPDTGALTSWSTLPYTMTFDLALAPDGMVWATVQPYGKQALLRLDPAAGQLTAWELPGANARPFRVDARSADAVWLSEADATGNAVARFVPATNQLTEYALPVAAAGARGIVAQGSKVWVALEDANALAQLDMGQPATRVTVRQAIPLAGKQSRAVITPTALTQKPSKSAAYLQTRAVATTAAGGFTLAGLPAPAGPFGLAPAAAPDEIWFAATDGSFLGRLELPERVVYLPWVGR